MVAKFSWELTTTALLITKVFREMKWVGELDFGKKNIKKYASLYYNKYKIEIQNTEENYYKTRSCSEKEL
jgi:hypothetical protein